jgi:UDPglucose 6-dehydrogenase
VADGSTGLKICVLGLWHLGSVTASCLAAAKHHVVGLDFDSDVVNRLREGAPPISEPGLQDLIRSGLKEGHLSFTGDTAEAVAGIDVLWITYDTPVDADDRADVQFVIDRVERVLPHLRGKALVLISSQLPVGTTRLLEAKYENLSFAYSPENLRLGKAIAAFTQPDRVVIGIRRESDRPVLEKLFDRFTNRIEWMSIESAEMTKHALNAFLATSVTFINEIAVVCEQVGADAKEVERGLKSEPRIGAKAYLSPGAAFAGGTLARDISFLVGIAERHGVSTHLLRAVRASNDHHRQWTRRKVAALLGDLQGQTIAVWGLTYKPGTDTLRRSSSVELCEWLFDQGARIRAHDPAVKTLPDGLSQKIAICERPLDALDGAAALVVATEWPDYTAIDAAGITSRMASPIVLDPTRFLAKSLQARSGIQYLTIGKP